MKKVGELFGLPVIETEPFEVIDNRGLMNFRGIIFNRNEMNQFMQLMLHIIKTVEIDSNNKQESRGLGRWVFLMR